MASRRGGRQQRGYRVHAGAAFTTAGLLAACLATPGWAQTTTTFAFDNPVDVGSGLGRVGDLDRWEFDLGFDWDEDFRFGTIVGKKNATIIPEVRDPIFNEVIIPQVTADTRSGARFDGNISGSTGLIFYADYDASGVEAGAAFNYAPQITVPSQVRVGEFTSLSTATGLINDGSFDESKVDLPSFEAGMDFYFNLDLQTKIEAGLFPIAGYRTTNWNPDPINVNQSLLKFEFDLDPDSNPEAEGGIPPTFTMFEDTLFESKAGLLDNGGFVQDKQISVEVESGVPGVKTRVDIGEVQIVNPFGTEPGGFIGNTGERNLKIGTSLADDTITYTAESAILRLGLDLDGIAAYLGTGQSFTRIEEDIGENPFNDEEPFAQIVADLIDIKYGPEIGYRETVEVKTDFEVTLTFKESDGSTTAVALDDGGGLSIDSTWSGKWSELPEIAILGTEDVDVEVSFDKVTGEHSKRGVFYLTDYLQLTLLELESLNILDLVDLSLPPVYQGRTSLLGSLLGEFELEVTNETDAITPFDVSPTLAGGAEFTLVAAPTELVYSANGDGGLISSLPGSWRRLADGSVPSTLIGTTIFVGFDNMASSIMSTGDTDAMTLVDAGGSISGGTAKIEADALQLPTGSTLRQFAGQRIWDVARIANDGTIESNTAYTQFGDGSPPVIQIVGDGTIVSRFGEMSFQSNILIHGPGHTILFDHHIEDVNLDSGPLHFLGELVNAGTIHYLNSEENSGVGISNSRTGVIKATDGSLLEFFNGTFENQGLILADTGSTIVFNQGGEDTITAPGGRGTFRADNGSTIRFKGNYNLGDLNNTDASQVTQLVFEVGAGSEIDFEGRFKQSAGFGEELTVFNVEAGGTLRLNGIEFPGSNDPQPGSISPDDASNFIDIVNDGTIVIESGRNQLFVPGVPPLGSGGSGTAPPQPSASPLNLVNRGEVIIQEDSELALEVEIEDYSELGAALSEGAWTLIGETPASLYSNLTNVGNTSDSNFSFNGEAILAFDVVRVSNIGTSYLSLAGFEDTNGDGVITETDGYDIDTFETDLAINATTVTLSGKALFPYFNTIEENRGTLNLQNRQNFITAGDLLNTGTINIESNARLGVQGRLTVGVGGVVNAIKEAGSTPRVDFASLEINGGEVNASSAGLVLDNVLGTRDDGYLLNSGITIIVREDTAFAEENVDPVTTPGVFNIQDSSGLVGIARSNGTIVMDGADASFAMAKHMQYNHGTLEIRNGHVWESTSPSNDFRNAPEGAMLLQGGQFLMDGTFRNDGDLTIDSESYLKATTFTQSAGATLRLDGVIEADSINVPAGSAITGTGRFSGLLAVEGTFAPGNSTGIFTVFQDLVLATGASLEFELNGTTPGEDYDRVVVKDQAIYGGTVALDFQSEFVAPSGFEWVLVEADQGIGFVGSPTTTGLDAPTGEEAPAPRDPLDFAIGQFNGTWLFLTTFGGDGDDLALYAAGLPGDTDGDGDVDDADLGTAFSAYTSAVGASGGRTPADGDTDGDGDVDDADLGTIFSAYTGALANTQVPEPGVGLLLVLGGLITARRRRA